MKGILCIDKPAKATSSNVVVATRRILGEKSIGHMGTLDPQGTGILLLGVGKATRLFDYYLNKDKIYEAEFEFGYETDTLDGDGKVISTTDILPDSSSILNSVQKLVGEIMQTPPKYSAKSIDGKRAYDLARNGVEFELKPSKVNIYSIEMLSQTCKNKYKFKIHCSSGTYIRSICRDLAYSLDSLATMTSIRRTHCGNFTLNDCVTLEALAELKQNALISVEAALSGINKVILPSEYYDKLNNGIKISAKEAAIEDCFDNFALYCKDELFGIATINAEGILKIKTYLRD